MDVPSSVIFELTKTFDVLLNLGIPLLVVLNISTPFFLYSCPVATLIPPSTSNIYVDPGTGPIATFFVVDKYVALSNNAEFPIVPDAVNKANVPAVPVPPTGV